MAQSDYKTHGVNIDYMDIDTLWNERRDPHQNPQSSSPRRMGRAPSASALHGLVEQIYRAQPTHRAGDE